MEGKAKFKLRAGERNQLYGPNQFITLVGFYKGNY
jgi:hypothetical protein